MSVICERGLRSRNDYAYDCACVRVYIRSIPPTAPEHNNVEKYLSRFSKQIRLESPNLRAPCLALWWRAATRTPCAVVVIVVHIIILSLEWLFARF